MSTRRGLLAALGASVLGGCTAFPRDGAAPTTNFAGGPQVDVDISYDADAAILRCVVDMGTTLTATNTRSVTLYREDAENVPWVGDGGRQSFPLEPGDELAVEWADPGEQASVVFTAPSGRKSVFGDIEFDESATTEAEP